MKSWHLSPIQTIVAVFGKLSRQLFSWRLRPSVGDHADVEYFLLTRDSGGYVGTAFIVTERCSQ
jgi:hypothetical protein